MRLGLIPLFNAYYTENRIFAANGLAYIAAELEARLGYRDVFVEVEPERLMAAKPDIVGISCTTQDFNRACLIARRVKEQLHIPVLLGGIHISALPHRLPPEADIGILGEGEHTLVELMPLFLKGEVNPETLASIKGLIYRDETGALQMTPPRPMVKELDDLSLPRRDLFLNKSGHWHQGISTSRGCYFDCVYCSAASYWVNVRYHSPERVLEDIEEILRRFPHQTAIAFDDLLFAINRKRLRRIVELVREAGIHRRISFTCSTRANAFTEEMAYLLKSMNCRTICFGYESPLDRVMQYLKGPSVTMDTNFRSMELCRKYGLHAIGLYIIGTPLETRAELAKTYWIIKNNKYRHTPHFFYMTPLPGTAQWNECVADGFVSDDMEDFSMLNLQFKKGYSIFVNKHYSVDEFERYHNLFMAIGQNEEPSLEHLQSQMRSEYILARLKEMAALAQQNPQYRKIAEISDHREQLEDAAEDLKLEAEITRVLPESLRQGNYEALQDADLIFFVHSLEQLDQPARILAQIQAVAKPGAHFYAQVYNARHVSLLGELAVGRWEPVPFGIYQDYHLRFYDRESLEKLFTEAGFQQLELNELPMGIERYKPILKNLWPLLAGHLGLKQPLPCLNVVSYTLQACTPTPSAPPAESLLDASLCV